MFTSGTRIVLQASSIVKGIGPKRGSMGYVIRSGDVYEVPPPASSCSFMASVTEVMFSYYGLEKRARCEYRLVMSVIPTANPRYLQSTDFKTVFEELAAGKLKSQPWQQALNNFISKNPKAIIGVAVPASFQRIYDMASTAPLKSQAWIESLLRSSRFIDCCRRCHATKMHKAMGIEETTLRWIADANVNKAAKLKLMEWIAEDKNNRQTLLTTLRKLDSVYNRREISQHLLHFAKIAGSRDLQNNPMRLLGQHFFDPEMLERKEEMLSIAKQARVLIDLVRDAQKIRDMMLSLVPAIR